MVICTLTSPRRTPASYPIPQSPLTLRSLQVRKETDIETALKTQLFVSAALMTPVLYKLCFAALPSAFFVSNHCANPWRALVVVEYDMLIQPWALLFT